MVPVRLPEDVVVFIKEKHSGVSEYIRKLVEREVRRERLLAELKKVHVKWKKRPSVPVTRLIREDRDVLL